MQEFNFKYGKFAVGYITNDSVPAFTITMDLPDAVFTARTGADGITEMKLYFRPAYRVKYFDQHDYMKKFKERDIYYPLIAKHLQKDDSAILSSDNIDFHVKNVYVGHMRRNGALYTGASVEISFNVDAPYIVTNDIINIKKVFSKAFNEYMKDVPQYDVKAHEEDKREHIQGQRDRIVSYDDLPF